MAVERRPWTAAWPALAAVAVSFAALAAEAVFWTISSFNDYAELYAWYLLILVLAAGGVVLAVRAWRRARGGPLGQLAYATTVAVALVCIAVSGVLAGWTLVEALLLTAGN
jgi:hypothetical protein